MRVFIRMRKGLCARCKAFLAFKTNLTYQWEGASILLGYAFILLGWRVDGRSIQTGSRQEKKLQ